VHMLLAGNDTGGGMSSNECPLVDNMLIIIMRIYGYVTFT